MKTETETETTPTTTTPTEAAADPVAALRLLTLGVPPEFKRRTVTIKGAAFEVRLPRAEERDEILRAGAVINGKNPNMKLSPMVALACVLCTYAPGTERRVFKREDVPALLERPAGDFVDVLGTEALDLMNKGASEQGNA